MGTPSHKAHDRLKTEDNNRKISTASSGSGTETAFERIATDAQAELKTDDFWDGRDTPSPNKLILEDQARREEQERIAREEAERNERQEKERIAREEAERKEREEKERIAREEAERKAREE